MVIIGQRLVVTIETNEKKLCNIYYHWGAYTYSALLHTKEIIDCIYNHKDETEKDMLLRLIRFCEDNGGGINCTTDEFKRVESLYPEESFKTEGYSRNDGLIALTEEGIENAQAWSEGDVFINLDTDQVDFCVYCGYEDLEEYIENNCKTEKGSLMAHHMPRWRGHLEARTEPGIAEDN